MRYANLGEDLPLVSVISLGSWNTFSRLSTPELGALLKEALREGINFFDVAYYWDKPDTETAFNRAIQFAGVPRRDYVLAVKLWLWDYPQRSFAQQLKDSLARLGTDYVDIVIAERPLPGMDFERFCAEVTGLISAGLCRAWGVINWSASQIRLAQSYADDPRRRPRVAQLQYNVCRRAIAESEEFVSLFAETDIKLVAALVLEGGILGGHLSRERVQPSEFAQGKVPLERNIARDSGGIRQQVRRRYAELVRIASELHVTPAQAATAFCLANPATACALIGVTKISDLRENAKSAHLPIQGSALREALRSLCVEGAQAPKLFNPHNDE